MNTAVFLRRFPPRGKLCHGAARQVVPVRNGNVALLPGGELAAYLIEHAGAHRLFVFRTVEHSAAAGVVHVPGVWPSVHLLASFDRPGRIDRVERLFRYLAGQKWSASALSDAFWLRVSQVLSGRRPKHKVLLSLLASEQTHPGSAENKAALRSPSSPPFKDPRP